MAKKNKFNLNSPSLGQQLVREAMTPYSEGFDISQLPQSYGINEFTTEQEVPVVEEAKDNKRSLAEDIVWNTGKLITNVLDNANPLYQYIQKERLSVGLSKLQDNLMETESKWIPQIQEAQNYLEAKSIVDNISNNILTDEQKIAVQTVNQLEPNIKEYAKSNPYLRDLFYDTDPTNVNGSIAINFKALLNDFKDNNIFNVNPLDNIATALEDNALNQEEQDFLWNNKQQQMSDKERLDAIQKVLSDANDEYEDKTAKIVKRQNTLKKGNWLYDPTALTKEFEQRVNESELSITDPKSWFYNLGHIGSSLSEIEMMFLQTGTSILANKAARSLAVRGAITAVPGIGQAATAVALGESAFNLWLAKYYRQSETASEVFDNYQQRVLQSANDNKTDVNRVLESWEPRLGELGYPVDQMDKNEKLQAGLAQGLTTDQKDFEEIRNDAFDGLQMVRDVNDALSYSDYLQSMPFSYGGKILWNQASKALAKARGIERPLDEIPSIVDQIGLGKAIDRGVENILNKASRPGQNITRKHLLENIGKFAKANAINFVSERSEEGVQSVVGSRYQRGEYDYLKDKGINPISAAYNAGLLGYEANLAYFGLSNDNYLNTDDELKKAMDIGGFIGLVMPFAGNAVQLKNAVRQYASDKEVQKLIAKGYSNAEQDNKMDVFLDALQAGKDINYVTDYLESAKKLKQPGVTDEMIDEDKNLATNLWAEYRNKSIDENLKDLGIKRGSSEHRKIVKNYLHIKDRLNEAEQSTNDVAKELEKIIEQGKTNKDDVFLQKARESYDAFVENKRQSDEDYQYKMNATPEYADEIEQDFLSTLPTFDEYSNAVYDITYLKLQNQAITDLYKALTNRTKTLQQLSEDTGLDVDLRNINNMRNYIKREKERIERNVQQIVSTYGIQNLDQAQDPVNAEQIKNYVTAFVMNKAVRDRLRDQATAYITGKLKAESYQDIKGYLFKDLSEEQQDNIIQEYTDKALREGKPQPSRKSIISKYNQQAQMKYNDLLELADQERASRIVANSLFAEHLSKSVRQEKVARKEKEEAGEVLPQEEIIENPAAATEDTTKKQQEKTEVKPETPIQEGIQQQPVVQETKTETVEPVVPESMSTDVDDILREEEQALLNQKGRQLEIEPSSEDVLVERVIEEQIQQPEREVQDIIAREEKVDVTVDDVSHVEDSTPSPQELEQEDIRNRTLQNPDEVSGVSEQTSEEVPEIAVATDAQEANEEQNTNTKDKSNPVPPTPTQVEDSKPAQDAPTITIVDGGIYVNDGTTFISDEVLAAEAQMLEDTSTEVYGETGYANMKPETVTNNSDALSNRKVQKVKHVSNTFFFQPDATSPMNITVNGKPITFTNSKGEVIPVLPGKELSKRLLKNGWINSVNAYYIVTNHRYGDTSPYMQAIHLVLEDTDGVMIASLRTPDYVDKEIASGNYNSEQVQQLQKQKEKLIEIRQQIVNSYLGSNKTIPTTIIKSVKPAKLRISNGEFNNQKSPEGAPIRRKLTEVNDFGLEQNNVRKLDQQVKEMQIGYGTGSVEDFVTEPFVIRKLGSNDELAGNGVGRSGALYIFPKAEQTPNGSIAPIQLSIHKLDYDIYGDEVELGKDGKVNSLAELAYKLLIGKIKLGGAEQDVLNIIVNNGPKTLISEEIGQKYPFLMDKMLYYQSEEGNTHVQFAVRNSNGKHIKVEFDPSRASESQHKLAIRKIAKDLHWNTDKYALLEPIPDSIVRLATSYFKQYPNAKQFKIAGLEQLAFTREDLGIGTDKGPVSLLTWLINTGKIETDLGDTIYRTPFIYTDGVAVPQVTETELANQSIHTEKVQHSKSARLAKSQVKLSDEKKEDGTIITKIEQYKDGYQLYGAFIPVPISFLEEFAEVYMPNNTKVGIVKIYNKNGQYSAHMRYEVDGVESFRTEQLIKNPIPYIQQFTSSIESKQSESNPFNITNIDEVKRSQYAKDSGVFIDHIESPTEKDVEDYQFTEIVIVTSNGDRIQLAPKAGFQDLNNVVKTKDIKAMIGLNYLLENYLKSNPLEVSKFENSVLSEYTKDVFGSNYDAAKDNFQGDYASYIKYANLSKSASQIEYVSTDENWSEEQIKDWMKANSPQYKYKTGKWQVIRRNGKLQAAQRLAKRGLTSQVKGEGKLNVDEARQWLQDKLGIDKSDVVTSEAVFRMANAPQVYGALKVCMDRLSGDTAARIFLSEQSGQGVEFHEGFHYVSQLLINDKLREQVYQDYVKQYPYLKDASKQEVEEALAEEFRQYMLNETKPSIAYRIKKLFNVILKVLGITRNGDLVRTLFNKIRKGEFSKYKPSKSTLEDFEKRFGGALYYYVPGVEDKELKKIASIADATTFYAVVDSLNATVMDTFNISSIEDLQSLPKKINDIFDDILTTNLELGMYDESQEQLIKDVINNKEVFKKQIDDYLRNFSIIKKNTEESEEQEREERELGDNPDNTWDKESYTISKKANVAFKAKLFFYSIPKTKYEFDPETGNKYLVEEEDDLLMTTRSEDFNVVWNKILENLWNVESYLDLVDKCYNLGKVDPFFMTVYNKLTSKDDPIDEVTQTQILNTVKSAKNSLTAIIVERKQIPFTQRGSDEQIEYATQEYSNKLKWRIQNSDVYRKISRLPKKWSQQFFLSDLIDVNEDGTRTINQDKFHSAVWKHKILIDNVLKKKDKTLDDYIKVRSNFIDMCNNLFINMDDLALDYLLTNGTGQPNMQSFENFWRSANASTSLTKSILNNINIAAIRGTSSIKSRSGETARTFDRIFTSRKPDAQINLMAIAWGRTHPSPEEFSVTGADGNLVYPITENNYMSDQIRWLKYNLNGKRELLGKNPYSANSLLLQSINSNADLIKLNTYLNLEENLQNTNRDYFGISPIEDYLSKMTFGFNNHLFCPTMSDKKTWHTISGIQMVKDFLPSTAITDYEYNENGDITRVIFQDQKRRFSDRTLNIFKGYLRDEYNAIQKYFATKQSVIDNPNLSVGNYHGSKKGKFADGNGGRFRYFNKITINGDTYNLNEILAKAEYSNDSQSIQDILSVIKQALDNDTVIKEAINDLLVDYVNNEISKAIELGVIGEDLSNKYIPINFVEEFEKISSKTDSRDKGTDVIYSIIASHAINSAISTIEIEKCFTGDPALYKWQKELMIYKPNDDSFVPVISDERTLEAWIDKHDPDGDKSSYSAYYMITGRDVDKIKRLSSVLSTGTNLRTKWGDTKDQEDRSDSKFQVLQLSDNEIGSTVYDTLYSMFRKSLIKDMFQKEFGVTDQQALNAVKDDHAIESTLGRLRKKNPDAIKFIEQQAKNSAKPYADGEINQADAAVYIRPEFYKRLMKSLGEWSPEIEEAYNIMESDDSWLSDTEKYQKAIKAITQPLKMVYFGDHFDQTLGMNVNTFDKMALFPLFKTFAKADNKYLYDRMNDASKGYIDMVAFESAIKVGGRKKLSFYKDGKVNLSELTSNSDIDGISGKGLATYTQDLTQIRLQLNTDPHEHLERSFGTQAIKIGFANVVDTRTYGENKGLAVKGSEIKKNIMDAINSLSRIGQNKIRKEFFTNGKVDNRKIVNYLQRQATNSGMSAEIIANLTVDENGNIIVPIEAQSIRDWIQTKITSFVNKAVVDVNTPGGSAIQMSSFAYEAVGRSVKTDAELGSAFNQGKKLKFLAKEGHMQVILSENFFRDILPEELKSASFYSKRKWLIDNGIIGSRMVDGVEVESKPYGIGYRIPTQGLSSMFSFQVADIMPTTIGDTIIVPEEFTAMTGSDFDVDKLYLATYTYKDGKRVSSDEKSEQGYVNKLLDNYSLVLTDFTNIAETRASIDTLTKILQKQILPIVQPKNTVEVNPMYELAPSFQLSRKTEYTGGKAGIAPFALNSTNHALTQFTHLCINYSNANRYNLGQLDQVYGEDDQRIMDWLSALINAHVDVAKDPYIMALNVNSITYNMTSLLIRGGKGENTFYFLAQPALRRFTKEMLESKGIIGAEKGITERDKLKSIAKEYMTSLRAAIVSLDDSDSNKAKYAQYYNSLASEYSLPSIEGYDAVEVNYNDVFDKKVASEALKKPKEVNGLYQQVISIRAYQDLSSDTEVLSNLVQLSQIDTKKFGNTLPLQLNFKRRLNRYIDNYQSRFYINGADNIEKPINYYLSSTFLKQKLDAGINTPRILLSGQVIEATKGYKTIFNAACDFFLGNSSDKNTVAELSKILTTSLRTKAVVNAVEDFNISDKKFLNMLRGPKSIAKRLTQIKNDLRKRNDLPAIAFNGHIKNELLNYLQEYASDGTNQKYDRIVTADNALTNTATYENRLLSAYQDLLDCEDEGIRKFANRLGVYAYLTSFDNRSTDSFFDVITTAWKKQKGYSDAIKAAIEILNNDKLVGMDYFGFNSENMQNNNFTELFTEIARNAYRNDKIVKPYQLSNYDNKYGTLVQIKPESKPIPAVFSSWRANQPFIKIQLNPNDINSYILYQKVATVYQTDENGDPVKNTKQSVYKIIPALGTKDDRKVYYEYQKQSGEQSAFEENALPKEAIWNNGQIEQLVQKFFEPMTNKNHTTLVYESSDAIVINTVEKQEIVSFEEPEVTTVGSDLEASNEIHNTEDTQSSTIYGEVDEQISTITVGQDDSVTLLDMQVDMEDGTQTIISDDVLNFTEITDDVFGESPYFDSILNAGITQYEQVQDIITDMNTGTDTVQDMKFNDEAYKNCKGK